MTLLYKDTTLIKLNIKKFAFNLKKKKIAINGV